MEYQEALAAFFAPSPPDATEPPIVGHGGAARRLRDALEPIAMHAVWCRHTNECLAAEYGLDFLGSYVWGRASALGDPAAGVVVAAFAVFEPHLITGIYGDARAKVAWPDLVATRDRATAESLRELLGDADVSAVTTALRRGIDAADGAGRPMFAGLAGRAWPEDPFGQLWRACDIIREHRGDSHVAAFVAAGMGAVEMNILTEVWLGMPMFSYSATRGWSAQQLTAAADQLRSRGLLGADAIDGLSTQGRRLRDTIESRTDLAQQRVIEAIGEDLDGVVEQLDTWSAALVAAKAFPPSIHKRAAG